MPKQTKKKYDSKQHKEFLKRCFVSDKILPASKATFYGTISPYHPCIITDQPMIKTKYGYKGYLRWKDNTCDLSPQAKHIVLDKTYLEKNVFVYYHNKNTSNISKSKK